MTIARRSPLWLLLPLAVLFALVFLYPLLRTAELALLRSDSLANLQRLFEVPLYSRVLGRTLYIACLVTLATTALAYPLAAFIAGRPARHQPALIALLFVPLLTSVVVRAYVWVTILRPNGVLDGLAQALGLPPLEGALFHNDAAVLIGMVHLLTPFAALPIYAGFRRLDPQLRLAAASLGADARRQWWRVVAPLTLPSVTAAAVLVFLSTLGFVVTPAILGGPRAVMLGVLVQRQAALNDYPFAALLATTLVVTTVVVMLGLRLALGRFRTRGLI
jgi:ABC-type spermidine/putrescine transport system permease subunit I